jgi:hypothetical protein
MSSNGFRLFLRLGDIVTHRDHREWGDGTVVEEMTSTVPGGTCLVRVAWQDGRQRTFNNDLDAQMCCYYFGVRKYWGAEEMLGQPPVTRRTAPRLAASSSRTRRRQT